LAKVFAMPLAVTLGDISFNPNGRFRDMGDLVNLVFLISSFPVSMAASSAKSETFWTFKNWRKKSVAVLTTTAPRELMTQY